MELFIIFHRTNSHKRPQVFSGWFTYTYDIHSYATTSSTNVICENYFDTGEEQPSYSLYAQSSRLKLYGDKLVKVCGPKLWNNIPFYIQDANSIITFKEKLKKYFLLQYGN